MRPGAEDGTTIPFAVDDAVIAPSGQIGRISFLTSSLDERGAEAQVQFGADGPFRKYSLKSLRWTTEKEVRAAGMYGTTFTIRVR